MKTLHRTLLTLIAAIAVALAWSAASRTSWADSLSLLGIGQNYESALQPLVKVAAAILVMVTATQLIQGGARLIGRLARSFSSSPGSAPAA